MSAPERPVNSVHDGMSAFALCLKISAGGMQHEAAVRGLKDAWPWLRRMSPELASVKEPDLNTFAILLAQAHIPPAFLEEEFSTPLHNVLLNLFNYWVSRELPAYAQDEELFRVARAIGVEKTQIFMVHRLIDRDIARHGHGAQPREAYLDYVRKRLLELVGLRSARTQEQEAQIEGGCEIALRLLGTRCLLVDGAYNLYDADGNGVEV